MAGTSGTADPAPRRRKRKGPRPHPVPTHTPESTHRPASVAGAPSFGIDAPSLVVGTLVVGFAVAFIGVFVGSSAGLWWSAPFWVVAAAFLATGAAMVHSSLRGKAVLWDEVLDGLDLRGDEHALDAGCGRGLVLLALAQRLPDGEATGVDAWHGRDQSGNTNAATVLNAELAGVADRVAVLDGDLRALPVPDQAYDVVTASFAIHNLPSAEDRATATAELVRIARPGGRIVIVDIARTGEEAASLIAAGAEAVAVSNRRWLTYPPARVLTARRPT